MIEYTTDLGNKVVSTKEDFKIEVKEMIAFIVEDKEYDIKDINVNFVSEDITGNISKGSEGMSSEGLVIIEEVLKEYKKIM